MSDDPAPRLNPAKFRSGIVAGGGADPGAGVNDEADPAAGGGGVNSNVLAVLGRVLSSPRFSPLFLPDAPPLLPPLLPAGFLPRLDDDGVDAPIAKVPGARGVPLETSDAKDAFGENGFASAFAFAFVVSENGEGSVGRERFGEERFGENGGEAASPVAPEPGRRRRPPDASTPPGEKKSNGGGESGVPENVAPRGLGLADDGSRSIGDSDDGARPSDPTAAARLFAARLDASLDAEDAPSPPDPGERGPVDRRRG